MRGVVMHAPGDVRVEQREDPKILHPTDAVIRLSASCVCGSDLWPYRGAEALEGPAAMGHEYVGVVEEVGSEVRNVRPGQFVIGSFFASDNTCEICRAGYQSSCVHRELVGGAQAQYMRVPLADGTLVATSEMPSEDLVPSFGDVWFDVIYAGQEPSRMRANLVRFSPGARTHWHSHVLGQTLNVVSGIALIGTRDGTAFEALPGQTVTCPPGEEHWHGATPDRFMEHIAMWEGKGDGSEETTWNEPVTDEQYNRPRSR